MTHKLPREMIRRKILPKFIPLSSSQLDEKIAKDPDFPIAIKLSDTGRAVAWFADEIADYQERQLAKALAAAKEKQEKVLTRTAKKKAA